MYTEFNQVAQYFAHRMQNRVPRHKIALFVEHLANLMLLRYHTGWSNRDSTQNSEGRVLCVTRVNFQHSPNDLILSATNSVGLDIEEVLYCLPETVHIYFDPGRVVVRGESELDFVTPIWMGPCNADQDYQPGPYVELSLRPPEELGVDNPTDDPGFAMFRYIMLDTQSFTAAEFAQTRFGSLRKRPDPNQISRIRTQLKKYTIQG